MTREQEKNRHIENNKNTLIACRIPKEEKQLLKIKADKLGITINALAQGIIIDYIRKEL